MKYYIRFDSTPALKKQEAFNLFQRYYHNGSFTFDSAASINQGDVLNGIDPAWYNNNGEPTPEQHEQFKHFISSQWVVRKRVFDPFDKFFYLILARGTGDADDF